MKARLTAMEKAVAAIAAQKKSLRVNHALLDHANKLVIPANSPPLFDPTRAPAVKAFLDDDSDPNVKGKLIIGPFGSGKTSSVMQAILWQACTMPKCVDGVVRSCWAFVRNTLSRLETTVLPTWFEWTRFLPTPTQGKRPTWKYFYRFNCENVPVEMEIILLPLEHINKIDKLGSLQLTGGFINEIREIPHLVLKTLLKRIRRYPSKDLFKYLYTGTEEDYMNWFPYKTIVLADTNAPEEDHWLSKRDEKSHKVVKIFHQPPGCIRDEKGEWITNPKADNIASLDPSYYLDNLDSGQEFFNVYSLGLYGSVDEGARVYPEFNSSWHVGDNLITLIDDSLFYYGWDFGLTPAWLLAQRLRNGQLIVLKEIVTDDEQRSIAGLANDHVKPSINQLIAGKSYISVADPSGTAKNQNNLMSNIDVLCKNGIATTAAKTNVQSIRHNCLRQLFNKNIEGKPSILIDRVGCPVLIKALGYKHCWHRVGVAGKEMLKNEPKKLHPYSDIVDCLEYIAVDYLYSPKKDEHFDASAYCANPSLL
jgi:hypothetical protein